VRLRLLNAQIEAGVDVLMIFDTRACRRRGTGNSRSTTCSACCRCSSAARAPSEFP
jgi:hypothetical protein